MNLVPTLKVEYNADSPQFPDTPTPRLSWITQTDARDWVQSSVEVSLTTDSGSDSVVLTDDTSVFVDWPFPPLEPGVPVSLRVRSTGGEVQGEWSEPIVVERASAPLTAQLITLPAGGAADQPGQFRTDFESSGVVRARLIATARGAWNAEINGVRVGADELTPGWTVYEHRLLFHTYDVTDLLHDGANAIGLWQGGAWYTERYGFHGRAKAFHHEPAGVLAQLELTLADGTSRLIATSADWHCRTGPMTSSSIYRGENFDARLHDAAWSTAQFDSAEWDRATEVAFDRATLEPAMSEPVRATGSLDPVSITTSPSGRTIIDFGQNLVGRPRITGRTGRGTTITLRHAEVLEGGELATGPLRYASATDMYIASGYGVETWQPRFTFHGFRYLEVTGIDIAEWDISAIVLGSDLRRTGWFESSQPLVNRLFENSYWSARGNFLSVPTDCPQRDERLGWTGDFEVFAPAGAYLFDINGFSESWLRDVAIEQSLRDGVTPVIVPSVMDDPGEPIAAWGDATTIVPWTLYERYGDVGVLRRHAPSMRAWCDAVLRVADEDGLWTRGYQLGDWLDPTAPPTNPGGGKADQAVVASAYLYRSLKITSDSCALIGEKAEAERYGALAKKTRSAFLSSFVTPAGRIVSEAQTTYSLALEFGLVTDEPTRQQMGRRLAELVREGGYVIGTGFVGTPIVLRALAHTGQLATLSRLLLQTRHPSWLYPVTMGATTIWERWDSMFPDGSINADDMASFNHYAFGAVADWLCSGLAGLSATEPGYRRLLIAPTPVAGFDHANTRHLTPYGEASVGWKILDGTLTVAATVPPNTRAEVVLPGRDRFEVGSGHHEWSVPAPRETAGPSSTLDLSTTLDTLVDDPEAISAVVAAVSPFDPGRARAFENHTRWKTGVPLSSALMFVDPRALDAVASALAELSASRQD